MRRRLSWAFIAAIAAAMGVVPAAVALNLPVMF
jgi:hypothetical protein